jgi:hypothetical protein
VTSERRAVVLLAVLAALGAAPRPAAADWLVTRDGGKIETKGPWRVDGRQILFTLPNGTLSSVRAGEIDLDLSALETTRALEAKSAPVPAPPKREPVLRLTEKEIPPMREESEEAAEGKKGEEASTSGLAVGAWEKTESASGDGIEIFGTLRNGGTNNITSPSLMVMIYDADGGLIATNTATLSESILMAGRSCNFRVSFPGVNDFAAVKFDPAGRGFRSQSGGAAEGEEGTLEGAPPAGEEVPADTTDAGSGGEAEPPADAAPEAAPPPAA